MKPNERLPKAQNLAWLMVVPALIVVTIVAFAVPGVSATQAAPARNALDAASYRKYFNAIEDTFKFVVDNYVDEVDPEKLYEGVMKGLFESLNDPHSIYFTQEIKRDMEDLASGSFGGLGINISKQSVDPANPDRPLYVEVVSPIEGTPAFAAGVQPGDIIVAIEGESTAPLTIDDVMRRLRGEPGTKVSFTVLRNDTMELPFTLTRAIIELPYVKSDTIKSKAGSIGYLRIIEFSDNAFALVKKSVEDFKKAGCKALVIDLRYNGGGLLGSSVDMADLFLTEGVIVATKSRIAEENIVYEATPAVSVPMDMPIIVLVNRGSASASEILAGALKDYKRAILVGEKTYGKGSVQQPYMLGSSGFKITVARYYTPSDANIDKIGIPPDVEIVEPEFTDAENAAFEKLMKAGLIGSWAKANPGAGPGAQAAFVKKLIADGYVLSERVLGRLVRNEIDRTKMPPVYELEFDIQLQEAVRIVESGKYGDIVKTAKTVKELQEGLAK